MFGGAQRVGRCFLAGLAIVISGCGPAPAKSLPTPTTAGGSAGLGSVPPFLASPASPSASSAAAGPPVGPSPAISLQVAVDGLTSPVDVADAGDGSGRLFVVEQTGRIRIVDGRRLVDRPFLDLSDRVTSGGEQGLLGLAFPPGYPADPRFYVDYTDLHGDTNISEFRVNATDPATADRGSERILLHIDQPFANHNGGGVVFGADGMLYVATGDGGSGGDPNGNGQRLDTLLAKILRIDVGGPGGASDGPYTVPPDNPFVGVAGAMPEIWLTGLRNPWRIRFDSATGDLWIGDVGQSAWEEIDVARAGSKGLDYGWNVMEGFHCYAPSRGCDQRGLTLPVAEYGHDLGCAVIGGVVVRGSGQPALNGRYVFADECSGNVWTLDATSAGPEEPDLVGQWAGSLSSIIQAHDGTLLATDVQRGQLLILSAAS